MSRPFRFSIQGGPWADPVALAEHARRLEALGYDELFTADHLGMVDPFVPLVVAALATERLRVGPLVLNNELHHPALLARTAASVDAATGGRLVLGLGTGYQESEHDALGMPIRPPGPRVGRFDESLVVLRSLLDENQVDHDGEHLSVRIDDLGVRPSQEHVPFLIGGHGPRVVRTAARRADIYQFTGLTHGEGGRPTAGGFALADVVERAAWLAEAAGEREIERSVLVQHTAVGDDAPSAPGLADRFQLDVDVLEHTPFVLVGSLAQVVDKLERLREAIGISHVVVRDPDGFAPVVEVLAGR